MTPCDRTSPRPSPGFPRTARSRYWLAVLLSAVSFSATTRAADPPPPDLAKLWRGGEYAEVVPAAAALLTKNGADEAARVFKIRAEMEQGLYADALATLDDGLKKLPGSVMLRWHGRDVCRFNNQAERAAALEAEIIQLLRQAPWRYSDGPHQVLLGRLMVGQGAEPKKVLQIVYNEVKKRQPTFVDVQLAIGDLALSKHDYKLAGDAFQQAVKLDADDPEAHFGVAQAFAPSDAEKTDAALKAVLKLNPRHVRALLMLVDNQVDAEQYDDAEKTLGQVTAVNPRQPQALAYRAVLAHLKNQPENERVHRAAALQHWPQNPDVDHLIGRKLSQKYRFAEGAAYQRRALELDPKSLAAKGQLSQDLLRLGEEEEGLKLAEEVYAADGFNIFAHNLVTLQESLAKFRTLEADGLLVRMDAREAEIYGARVVDLLTRARTELCRKYEVELTQPIIVELFPRQEDFAIRTFGLPGGAGFLGVCFGTVITANSPASQGASPSNWEATLWHEFCHVVTLNKTGNKMPRWLSEGISVYEERQADRTWGQTLTPQYRAMILGDDLTPVSQLSGAFLHPKTPLHLQFAYFESSLVVEYLVAKHGDAALRQVLVDLGAGIPINEALVRVAGSIAELDTAFAAYAREQAHALAPDVDWSQPELPKQATIDDVLAWLEQHPNNYAALRQLVLLYIADKQWLPAETIAKQLAELYPANGTADSPYPLLVKIYHEMGDAEQERAVLQTWFDLTASDLDACDRLGEMASAAGDWPTALRAAQKSLAINPLLPAVQRRTAAAAEQMKDDDLALASYRAQLLLDPLDRAELHYRLAQTLKRQGKLAEAKRETLLALEETPRFRAAQRLLLQLVEMTPTTDVPAGTDEKPSTDAKPPDNR